VPIVTALRRKRPQHVQVELDGAPWRTLPDEVVLEAGLYAGLSLGRARLRKVRRALRKAEANALALRLLRRRDLSVYELEERLGRRRIAPRDRAVVLDVLVDSGVVADERLACDRARVLAARGLGDEAIRHHLRRRGLPQGPVDEGIAQLAPEDERAARLAASLGGGARAARMLARKGFSAEAIEASVPETIAESP
jgi:SOS response regulatory protein OraA/RecX